MSSLEPQASGFVKCSVYVHYVVAAGRNFLISFYSFICKNLIDNFLFELVSSLCKGSSSVGTVELQHSHRFYISGTSLGVI